jgi:hypothetical protein
MKRRSLLKSLGALPAAAAVGQAQTQAPKLGLPQTPSTAPTVDDFKLAVTSPDVVGTPVRKFLTADEFATLEHLAAIIVPPFNGRPGAKEAKSAEFLDFLISGSPDERQQLYRAGLDGLNAQAKKRYNKNFAALSETEVAPLLAPLTSPWTYDPPKETVAAFLVAAKEDVMRAVVNSRETASLGRRNSSPYWFPIE